MGSASNGADTNRKRQSGVSSAGERRVTDKEPAGKTGSLLNVLGDITSTMNPFEKERMPGRGRLFNVGGSLQCASPPGSSPAPTNRRGRVPRSPHARRETRRRSGATVGGGPVCSASAPLGTYPLRRSATQRACHAARHSEHQAPRKGPLPASARRKRGRQAQGDRNFHSAPCSSSVNKRQRSAVRTQT